MACALDKGDAEHEAPLLSFDVSVLVVVIVSQITTIGDQFVLSHHGIWASWFVGALIIALAFWYWMAVVNTRILSSLEVLSRMTGWGVNADAGVHSLVIWRTSFYR